MEKVLDLFCTNKPGLTKNICTIPGISDNDIKLVDSNLCPPFNKQPSRKIFQFDKADWAKIKQDCQEFQHKFLSEYLTRSVEDNWVSFKKYIEVLMTTHILSKFTNVWHNLPWLSDSLKQMCKKKERFFSHSRRTGKPKHKPAFQALKKSTRSAMHKAYWSYLKSLFEEGINEGNYAHSGITLNHKGKTHLAWHH